MNNYQLNTNWCLWYHSINDTCWKNSSYKNLYTIKNLYDIKCINDSIEKIHLQNGMFFIMREDIFPTWEDPENREGSSISYKIPASYLKENWTLLLEKVIFQEFLTDKGKNTEINGISISPKKEFNIIKIWLKNYDSKFIDFLNEYPPYIIKEKMIHKKHIT